MLQVKYYTLQVVNNNNKEWTNLTCSFRHNNTKQGFELATYGQPTQVTSTAITFK